MYRGIVSLLCVLAATSAGSAPRADRVTPDAGGARREALSPAPASPAHALRRPLPFFYDLYTFRGVDRHTAVIAAFAVPAGGLEREHEDAEVRYRFDVTLVLADTALRSVTRRDDTVSVSVPHALDDRHLLYTQIQVQAAPSASTLQRVIMNDETRPGIGQLYTSPFPIPDYGGSDLMLSDIALGRTDAQAGWRRGDVQLALLPTSQFPEGSFDLYYEIYNLPFGHRYGTEIAISPVDDSGNPPPGEDRTVRTRFSAEAATRPDGSLAELRRVEADLDEGRYRLTVTVTDQDSGLSTSRSRSFEVRPWARGATMVPALPRRQRIVSGS
jgi:hypothetical protein